MSKKFKNRGSGWGNPKPKSKNSMIFMGSALVGKNRVWMNAWLQAPDDCPEIAKAIKALKKAIKDEHPKKNKGVKPMLTVSFRKQS